MGGHKGANALFSDEQVLHGQLVDGFSNRALTDLIARCQIALTGDGLTWAPLACSQALQDQGFDLLIKGTEGGDLLGRVCWPSWIQ
jgi:hypothetical protein